MNDIKGDWCYWIWINLFQGIRSQEIPGNIRLQFPLKMWSVNYATSSVSSWNFSECENFFSKIVREAPLLCNFIRADLSDASHSLPQYCHDLTLTGMKMRWLSQNQFPELSRYNTHQWRRTMHVAIHYFPNCKLSHYLFMVHKPCSRKCCHPLKPNPLAQQTKSSIQHFPNQLIPLS